MKDFMAHLADQVWPVGKRYGKLSSNVTWFSSLLIFFDSILLYSSSARK